MSWCSRFVYTTIHFIAHKIEQEKILQLNVFASTHSTFKTSGTWLDVYLITHAFDVIFLSVLVNLASQNIFK